MSNKHFNQDKATSIFCACHVLFCQDKRNDFTDEQVYTFIRDVMQVKSITVKDIHLYRAAIDVGVIVTVFATLGFDEFDPDHIPESLGVIFPGIQIVD